MLPRKACGGSRAIECLARELAEGRPLEPLETPTGKGYGIRIGDVWILRRKDRAKVDEAIASVRRVLAIDRGGRGFFVANGGAAESEQTLTTSLPPGEYCDVVTGGVADGACVGAAVTVAEDGTVSLTIPPDSAVALHVGATAG